MTLHYNDNFLSLVFGVLLVTFVLTTSALSFTPSEIESVGSPKFTNNLMAKFHLNCMIMWKRMSLRHTSAKISPKKLCLKTNIDEKKHNLGLLLYVENLNCVFFHQYLTSNTLVLKILAEMCLKWHPLSHDTVWVKFCHKTFGTPNTSEGL